MVRLGICKRRRNSGRRPNILIQNPGVLQRCDPSYQTLYPLAEEAIGQQWSSPKQFPPPVLLWFKGQQQNLLRNAWPKTPNGVLEKLCQIAGIGELSSLVAVIHAILTLQLEILNSLQLKNKILNSHEDLWYIGFERPIQLKYYECGKQSRGRTQLSGQSMRLIISWPVNDGAAQIDVGPSRNGSYHKMKSSFG